MLQKPPRPRREYVATTSRPHAAIQYALAGWFAVAKNRERSNREAARELAIDEGTVRRYRVAHGIPGLEPGTGKPKARKRRHG